MERICEYLSQVQSNWGESTPGIMAPQLFVAGCMSFCTVFTMGNKCVLKMSQPAVAPWLLQDTLVKASSSAPLQKKK